MTDPRAFDSFARDYERALDQGLSLTGESRDFYAMNRVAACREVCRRLGFVPTAICDYGCGTGDTLPLLENAFGASRMIGFDPSPESIEESLRRHRRPDWTLISTLGTADRSAPCDLVYCNGVFHHIAPGERLQAALNVFEILRPGGLWLLWENNPFNPGTRWVMSRIPFDRDAVMLSPREARDLGERAGFTHVETSFHFFFPSMLRRLRSTERYLSRLPLGGQYLVVFKRNEVLRPALRAEAEASPGTQ